MGRAPVSVASGAFGADILYEPVDAINDRGLSRRPNDRLKQPGRERRIASVKLFGGIRPVYL